MNSYVRLAPLAFSVALVAGCGAKDPCPDPGASSAAAPPAKPDEDVLATVNGVPIRAAELQYYLSRKNKKEARNPDPARLKSALAELVDAEVGRQAALAAGLDADPGYQRKHRFLEAPFVQFQREELAGLYMRREAVEKGRPDEAELKAYFDGHAAELQSELHLMQIIVRDDEAKIRDLKKRIDGGEPFEAVAASLYPVQLPEGTPDPWDLGVMRWTQVPVQWREALATMKDGEASDVIAGPKGRFWIVKLVERKANAAITLELLRPELTEMLQAQKVQGLEARTKAALRGKAAIVYVRDPATLPPPAGHDD